MRRCLSRSVPQVYFLSQLDLCFVLFIPLFYDAVSITEVLWDQIVVSAQAVEELSCLLSRFILCVFDDRPWFLFYVGLCFVITFGDSVRSVSVANEFLSVIQNPDQSRFGL